MISAGDSEEVLVDYRGLVQLSWNDAMEKLVCSCPPSAAVGTEADN
jgi:hypothetical protein